MKKFYCSLETKTPQLIQPNTWTVLKFEIENADDDRWHVTTDISKKESGLIIPSFLPGGKDIGTLWSMVQWEPSDSEPGAGQTIQQFCRDPFGEVDSTGTDDKVSTPGKDFSVNCWIGYFRDGQPLSLRVCHNDPTPRRVLLAEFKSLIITL
jgi:hypothetical protein